MFSDLVLKPNTEALIYEITHLYFLTLLRQKLCANQDISYAGGVIGLLLSGLCHSLTPQKHSVTAVW